MNTQNSVMQGVDTARMSGTKVYFLLTDTGGDIGIVQD